MDRFEKRINWQSKDSLVLLNPRISKSEKEIIENLSKLFPRAAHLWIASSGSTQSPKDSVKLIALSLDSILRSAQSVNKHLESNSNDIWAQVLPQFHVGGLGIEARAFLSGAKLIIEKWAAKSFVELCDFHKVTLSSLVPAQIFDLVAAKLKAPQTLRAVVVGGGQLAKKLLVEAEELGWPLLPSFGMSEASSQIATARWGSPDMILLSHLEAKVDLNKRLYLKGDSLLTGFAQNQNGKPVFIDPKSMDGWYKTEDFVEILGKQIIPLGRVSDYIKILGEGVNLSELNEKLESLASLMATVVDVPHPRKENDLILIFEKSVSPSAQIQILSKFNALVRPYEQIEKYRIVEKIPRSDLGKVQKNMLRELLAGLS